VASARRRLLAAFLSFAGASLLALVCVELLLRLAAPERAGFFVWPPGMQRTFHPSAGMMPGVEGPSRFLVNSIGLRGREPTPDAHPRILCVGGSTTECLYLDQEESWPVLVERALGSAAWVANAGVSGRLSRDHVLQLEHLLPLLPGLERVVLLLGVNDLMLLLGQGQGYDPRGLEVPEIRAEALERAFEIVPRGARAAPFPRSTELWRQCVPRLKRLFERGQVQDEAGGVYRTWRAHRREASHWLADLPDLGPGLSEYRRNVELLTRISREHGARPLFLTQPCLWSDALSAEEEALLWMGGVGDYQARPGAAYYTSAALARGMRIYNEALLATCAELGADCLDLAAALPRDTTVFYDDVHFNEAGARRVAELVAAALR
jgi:lysophospholipase L1-like esterase